MPAIPQCSSFSSFDLLYINPSILKNVFSIIENKPRPISEPLIGSQHARMQFSYVEPRQPAIHLRPSYRYWGMHNKSAGNPFRITIHVSVLPPPEAAEKQQAA